MADNAMRKAVINHAKSDMANLSPEPVARPEAARPAKAKLGAEHAAGMVKLGFHEIAQALKAFPDANIGGIEEPGVAGNPPAYAPREQNSYDDALNDTARRTPSQGKGRSR